MLFRSVSQSRYPRPVGDLAVRRGWMKIHNSKTEISPEKLALKGNRFAGFQSVVAWYCWRAVDN